MFGAPYGFGELCLGKTKEQPPGGSNLAVVGEFCGAFVPGVRHTRQRAVKTESTVQQWASAKDGALPRLRGASLLHCCDNGIGFQAEFQGLDEVTVATPIDDGFHRRFKDVIDFEPEFDTCQRSRVRRISACHGLKLHLSRVNGRRAQKHQQIFFTVLFRELFNSTLNLKVHSTCGGSNKALRCGVYNLRPEPFYGLLDGVARDSVPLAEDCNFFPVNIHTKKSLSSC